MSLAVFFHVLLPFCLIILGAKLSLNHLSEFWGPPHALREETFLISTRLGVFDAFYIPKFHLSSPDFLSMILARIKFTKNMIMQKAIVYDDPEIEKKILKYFTIIEASLRRNNKQSKKLVQLIDNISIGNMRNALRMFNYFIVSGNTNVEEMFEKTEQQGKPYQIAFHQFIKSIMLGEHRYYSEERSNLMNLLDFDTAKSDSPFNLLRILDYLLCRVNKKSPIGNGYISVSELKYAAEEAAIRKEVIFESLLRLSAFSLVEFDNQSKTDIKNASYVKITHAGKYYLNYLIYEFSYLDTILVDTPIANSILVRNLLKYSDTFDLTDRLNRTEQFVQYLSNTEIEEFKDHPEYVNCEFARKSYAKEIAARYPSIKRKIMESNKSNS